ncbi:MAG: hypothetical protein ACJZ48_02870 [Candidatus Pelagibacterales bacterium]
MNELIENDKIKNLSFIETLLFIYSESIKISIVLLIFILGWFSYFFLSEKFNETSIILTKAEDMVFEFDKITRNYLNKNQLSPEELLEQYALSVSNFSVFSKFFEKQNLIEFQNLDQAYNMINLNKDGEVYEFTINYTEFYDQNTIEKFTLNYLEYTHENILKNIMNNISIDTESIKKEIVDLQNKDQIIKKYKADNSKYLVKKLANIDKLKYSKKVKMIKENLNLAKKLGYKKPAKQIESYLVSSILNIEENEMGETANNEDFTNKFSIIDYVDSTAIPHFFLGSDILEEYLKVLNQDLNNIEISTSQNYPEIYVSSTIEDVSYDKNYINTLIELETRLDSIKSVNKKMSNVKTTEKKLVGFNEKKIKTIKVSQNYRISFVISIILGLFFGIILVFFLKIIKTSKVRINPFI